MNEIVAFATDKPLLTIPNSTSTNGKSSYLRRGAIELSVGRVVMRLCQTPGGSEAGSE
jgi:hypothetical protein